MALPVRLVDRIGATALVVTLVGGLGLIVRPDVVSSEAQPPPAGAPQPEQPAVPAPSDEPSLDSPDPSPDAPPGRRGVRADDRQPGGRGDGGQQRHRPRRDAGTAVGGGVKAAQRQLAEAVRELVTGGETVDTTADAVTFRATVFNILGSQHSAPGGTRPGYASGTSRAARAVQVIQQNESSIVGFSEIQRDQLGVVMGRLGSVYDVWPGSSAGSRGLPQSMIWRTDHWTAVERHTFISPFNHQLRPMPYVLLRSEQNGQLLWAINVHNSPQGMVAERRRAVTIQLQLVRRLRQERPDVPVVIVGDFNDKATSLCRFLVSGMRSAVGGTLSGGRCRPPARPRVDWIFGTADLGYGPYVVSRRPPVPYITDHAVLSADLVLR